MGRQLCGGGVCEGVRFGGSGSSEGKGLTGGEERLERLGHRTRTLWC